ncbi:MAG TPA: 16S rRNA (uracil(1498)-N(3))-methyltransferase [Terriglobales bacterium]|jgi:16S rRNA (uracil1498-N3)-methyltransferase|nr:16S rRNA (uracil(1498)-N(3))-methyltransferase [Terriglobales bacterium]
MARFFVPRKNIRDQHAVIDGQELAHLQRVLRLGPGDRVTLFDDGGWEHDAVIRRLSAGTGELEILRSREAEGESPLEITLALGLTKGEKMDWVIEKATELGVHSIVPFVSSYAVPKFDAAKIFKRTERWRKIALSAAKQCGRSRVPEVAALCTYEEVVNRVSAAALRVLFWEREAERSLREVHQNHAVAKTVLLAIGPEGGFTDQEANLARQRGFEITHLGPRILRAETAAVTVVALAQFLWGDLG